MWIGKSANRICYEERVRLGKRDDTYTIFLYFYLLYYICTRKIKNNIIFTMKYSFDKLFRNNMATTVNKAAKERKAKSISASASLQTLFAAAAVAMVFSLQACMKQTIEEYGSTNGSNDISFICKESNGNSNSESNNNGNDNDKVTKTAPTTSLTQPIGLFAYKHEIPSMNTWSEQFTHNHQIKPIGGGVLERLQ